MLSAQYLPHLLYSMALTSVSIHLLRQRKAAEADRAQLDAQTTILQSTADRLRAREAIPDRELDRLLKLARSQRVPETDTLAREEKDAIGWGEVLLGRKEAQGTAADEWDRRDLEKVTREVRASS